MFKEHKKQEGSVLLCIFNFFFFFLFYCCNKPNAGSDSMHITFRWRKQITYIAFSITIIFIVILLFVGDSFFFSSFFIGLLKMKNSIRAYWNIEHQHNLFSSLFRFRGGCYSFFYLFVDLFCFGYHIIFIHNSD